MKYKYPDLRTLVFARAPVAGQVKTRMAARLPDQQVLNLYRALLHRVLHLVLDSKLAPAQLWLAGSWPAGEPDRVPATLPVFLQQGRDLGERMARAVQAGLEEAEGVILIGCDCPALDRDYLDNALAALAAGHEVVIGPAEDGGYVLLGLRRCVPELFEDLPWGTERVLGMSLERLSRLGLQPVLLPALWDVDRPEDLDRLSGLHPPLTVDQWSPDTA
ncbi:MAG: hypothetical protein RLZZ385_1011 [Pseudomonadota bacterium]|jgi:rSAM/selenodomain-associated transferase 1